MVHRRSDCRGLGVAVVRPAAREAVACCGSPGACGRGRAGARALRPPQTYLDPRRGGVRGQGFGLFDPDPDAHDPAFLEAGLG